MNEKTPNNRLQHAAVLTVAFTFLVVVLAAMFFSSAQIPTETTWLGIGAEALSPDRARALGIPDSSGGVIVGGVEGIAKRAGVRQGDVVTAVNNHPVRDVLDFFDMASNVDLRGGVVLDLIRDGSPLYLTIDPQLLGPRGTPAGLADIQARNPGNWRGKNRLEGNWLGVEAEALRAGGARELGLAAASGVFIDAVTPESIAESIGLMANDVVVGINGKGIRTPKELWKGLESADPGQEIHLNVYRGQKGLIITIPSKMTASRSLQKVGMNVPGARGNAVAERGGRMGGWGLGLGGYCVCPNCGATLSHQRGVPCYTLKCPLCGSAMVREVSTQYGNGGLAQGASGPNSPFSWANGRTYPNQGLNPWCPGTWSPNNIFAAQGTQGSYQLVGLPPGCVIFPNGVQYFPSGSSTPLGADLSGQTTAPSLVMAKKKAPVIIKELGMEVCPATGGGVHVTAVMGNSHAQDAGIKEGDIIIQFNGERVKGVSQFRKIVRQASPEVNARVKVLRNGRVKSLSVMVGEGEMEGVTPIR